MKPQVLLLVIPFFFPTSAYACKCNETPTVEASYNLPGIIVHGQVVDKQLVSLSKTMKTEKAEELREKLRGDTRMLELLGSELVFEIKLKVVESFKKNAGDTIIIYATINSASCGYKFEMQKHYIVYASDKSHAYFPFLTHRERKSDIEKGETYWTNHCTRTAEYDKSEADLLRKLKA